MATLTEYKDGFKMLASASCYLYCQGLKDDGDRIAIILLNQACAEIVKRRLIPEVVMEMIADSVALKWRVYFSPSNDQIN